MLLNFYIIIYQLKLKPREKGSKGIAYPRGLFTKRRSLGSIGLVSCNNKTSFFRGGVRAYHEVEAETKKPHEKETSRESHMMVTCATSGLVALALLVNISASVFCFQLPAKIK